MKEVATTVRTAATRGGLAQWVIAFLLGVIAVGVWQRSGPLAPPAAFAQGQPVAGARGVYAFTGPLARDQYGLFMLDIDQGTLWCYAFEDVAGTRKLRLIAARTWMYDRYLQDFNCAAPDFRMVQQLVNQQRALPGGALDAAEPPPDDREAAP